MSEGNRILKNAVSLKLLDEYTWTPCDDVNLQLPEALPLTEYNFIDGYKPTRFRLCYEKITDAERRQWMTVEKFRQMTYRNDDTWSVGYTPWDYEVCAKQGFYNISDDSSQFTIKCNFCKGVLKKITKGLCKLDKLEAPELSNYHAMKSPDCYMAQHLCCGNIALREDKIVNVLLDSDAAPSAFHLDADKPGFLDVVAVSQPVDGVYLYETQPAYEVYLDIAKRKESLSSYGGFIGRVTQDSLAHAGFIYESRDSGMGDRVFCFWCGGGLHNWRAYDDPWEEHTRHYPGCSYIRIVKGTAYVLDILGTAELANYDPGYYQSLNVASLDFVSSRRRAMLRSEEERFKSFQIASCKLLGEIKKTLSEAGFWCTSSTLLGKDGSPSAHAVQCVFCGIRKAIDKCIYKEDVEKLIDHQCPGA